MSAPVKMIMPFVDLKAQYAALHDSIHARMQKVLDHGQFIMGPEVGELEGRLAAWTGSRHCVTCASGTEALLIALMALNVKAAAFPVARMGSVAGSGSALAMRTPTTFRAPPWNACSRARTSVSG